MELLTALGSFLVGVAAIAGCTVGGTWLMFKGNFEAGARFRVPVAVSAITGFVVHRLRND